jgi:hypothetical protein
MKKYIAMTAILMLLAAPVAAADYAGHFGDMDTNNDDLVNWDEFKAHFPHAEESVFKEIAGSDSAIDHGEWHDFKEKHGYGHGEGKKHD